MSYPEHEKLEAIDEDRRNTVQEFIDWLCDSHSISCLIAGQREGVMADFFGIDLRKLHEEKEQIYQELRGSHQ